MRRITITLAFSRRGSYPQAVKSRWMLLRSCFRWTARARVFASSCARDPCWTADASVTFTDVRTCVTGIGMAHSYTKSEYIQSLSDLKGTLFDANITRGLHSGTLPIGVPIPLKAL